VLRHQWHGACSPRLPKIIASRLCCRHTLDLVTIPGSNVSDAADPSDTAPPATGLPDLTGTGWEYHTFKLDAFEGLGGKGFLRAKAE
jgi:hypothetical protein